MYLEWLEKGLRKPGKTQAGLAAHLGRHPSQITRMFKDGGRRIQIEELPKIAEYLEEPMPTASRGMFRPFQVVESYDPDAPEQPLDPDASPDGAAFPPDAIKELASKGGLGAGQVISTTYVRGTDEITTQDAILDEYWRIPPPFVRGILQTTVANLLVVECDGDSMRPTLEPKDRVVVDTAHKKVSPDGLYAIRNSYEDVVVKRLTLIEGEPRRIRVASDNPMHETSERGLDEVVVVGKVVLGLKLF